VIKILIDKDARTSGGDTVIHLAYHRYSKFWDVEDFLKAAEIVVHSGCNPAVCNFNGKMPIDVAVATGNIDVVRHLLALSRGTPLPSDILLAAMDLTPWCGREEIKSMLMEFQRGSEH
jgi:hypothetical protein